MSERVHRSDACNLTPCCCDCVICAGPAPAPVAPATVNTHVRIVIVTFAHGGWLVYRQDVADDAEGQVALYRKKHPDGRTSIVECDVPLPIVVAPATVVGTVKP